MHTVMSRPTNIGTSPSHRGLKKSTSFLSLRRQKSQHSSSSKSSPTIEHPSPHFDSYSTFKSNIKQSVSATKNGESSSPTPPLYDPSTPGKSLCGKQESFAFPTKDSDDDPEYEEIDVARTPKAYTRARSVTGPSSMLHPEWDDSITPALRFSGSTQHSETPPATPSDMQFTKDFPVLVSAPISGVETMDALVETMNGGADTLPGHSRFGISGYHPLYQPPLPTPPPGVVLGGGKPRRTKVTLKQSASYSSHSEDESETQRPPRNPRRRKPLKNNHDIPISGLTPTRSQRRSPHSPDSPSPGDDTHDEAPGTAHIPVAKAAPVPSISDIIRTYAPDGQLRPRTSLQRLSRPSLQRRRTLGELERDRPPSTVEEETEGFSRSSIDSIADEVLKTLKAQTALKPQTPSPYRPRQSNVSETASMNLNSPRSDGLSISHYAPSVSSIQSPSSPFETSSFIASLSKPSTPSQAVAQYLRSSRLTTLLKLTRSPHASPDNPLTVSLSDLGSSAGAPVLVFLGLGCVRHVMGLYDEMADCLGLRLITIDRWGLGRTEARSKSAKGILQWASVVDEVLDLLHVEKCAIMAHSAGAPYALSFANRFPHRLLGDICLLAPWVGGTESGGYKWLKYIPNGILKTAQAAEWKIQAWMIGKPPTITYEGIGYDAQASPTPSSNRSSSLSKPKPSLIYPLQTEASPRPSFGSSTFSEYDDLRDFDGRFESHSTLGASRYTSRAGSESKIYVTSRKNSRGFLDRLKGSPTLSSESPAQEKPSGYRPLKALRSMGSLKSKSSKRSGTTTSPQLPPAAHFDVELGLDDISWTQSISTDTSSISYGTRSGGRRAMSFGTNHSASMPASPVASIRKTSFIGSQGTFPLDKAESSYQALLGNALIAASHAESSRGAHNDLLQILNHDNHPWGFSYSSYPHRVRVWYGDKDEKIAENAVRWMEKTMGSENCHVKVVPGADHALMYRSSVVVEVLETLLDYWRL